MEFREGVVDTQKCNGVWTGVGVNLEMHRMQSVLHFVIQIWHQMNVSIF